MTATERNIILAFPVVESLIQQFTSFLLEAHVAMNDIAVCLEEIRQELSQISDLDVDKAQPFILAKIPEELRKQTQINALIQGKTLGDIVFSSTQFQF